MYWNPARILSYDRLFNFVVGGRGIGKTYGMKKFCLNNYFNKNEEFIYLRRYKEEIKPLKGFKFFESIAKEYPEVELKTEGERLVWRYPDEKWTTLGYITNLSTALTKKSVDYSNVTTIIYDEFIIPKGFIHYLPNEVESFLDFYETVARMRDNVRVFFLSNAISTYNPYFSYFNIEVPKEGQFYKDKEIVLEMCSMEDFKQKKRDTRFGKLISGTKYANYAIENDFYLDNAEFIAERPTNAKYYCTVFYRGHTLGIWADFREGKFYVSKKHDKNFPLSYALTQQDHTINTLYTKIKVPVKLKTLSQAYSYGVLFFETQEVKGIFTEALELIK